MAARLWLAAGIFCIAWSAIFVELAGVPGGTSAFYRLAIGAAVLAPLWLARREALPERGDLLRIAAGGVFFAIDMAAYNAAVLLATPATATLIGNTAPLFVGIVAFVWLRKHQPRRFWFGFALAIAGCAAIVGFDGLRETGARAGDALAFVSAAAFGMFLLITERTRARVGTLTFATLSAATSAILLAIYGLAARLPLGGFSARTWLVLAGLGLVSQVGGYLAIGKALGAMSAATASRSCCRRS